MCVSKMIVRTKKNCTHTIVLARQNKVQQKVQAPMDLDMETSREKSGQFYVKQLHN